MTLTRNLLIGLCCLVGLASAQHDPAAHVRNFGKVNDHLYRGGEPSLVGLQELGAMGVKVDIDLRESGPSTSLEEKAANRVGIKYINVPLPPFSAPPNDLVENVLSLLTSNSADTVFLHCRRGKDRTGTVIACYRVQHDGWDNRRALAEARQYGMSSTERGMRSYILHFTPVSSPLAGIAPVQ